MNPMSSTTPAQHSAEPHDAGTGNKLNWLRAGVLGANDGIVSTAGIVIGVAAASADRGPIVTAGVAGLTAGAVSMALGEYVSVSTQRDTEKALLAKERAELHEQPEEELEELAVIYESKGLTEETAWQVARELTENDAFAAHVDAELNIDPDELTNPWQAAISSALSFTAGALLPLVAILLLPVHLRIAVTFLVVAGALALTGYLSAAIGDASRGRAVLRVTIGGVIAMAATYLIGTLVGTAVG